MRDVDELHVGIGENIHVDQSIKKTYEKEAVGARLGEETVTTLATMFAERHASADEDPRLTHTQAGTQHQCLTKRDEKQIVELLFAYADEAEIDIEQLVTKDFLSRLDFACAHRWGLVIELLIDTLTTAKLEGKSELELEDFAEQFALRTGTTKQYSPYTAPDYVEAFDTARMLKLPE